MSSEGTPLHGDRSAWNVITFDTEHGKDIDDSTLRRHLPLPGAAGGLARSDGTDWQRVSSLALADLAGYARGYIIRGGAADWEAYDASTSGFILVGDGTDVASVCFDWDTMAGGASADMVHSHASAGEGGQISHDSALTGVSVDDHHSETHVINSTGAHAEGSLTIGHFLRATGVAAFSFAAIAAGDLPTAIDAAKIADGSVSNTEFQYLDDYATIGLVDLAAAEVDQLENIASTTISAAQWAYLGLTNQGLATTDGVTFASLTVPNAGFTGIGAALERIEFYTAGYVAVMGANFGAGTAAPATTLEAYKAAGGEIVRVSTAAVLGWLDFYEGAAVRGYVGFSDAGGLLTTMNADSMVIRAQASLHLAAGGNVTIMTLTGGRAGFGPTMIAPQTLIDARPSARTTAYSAADLTTWSDVHVHNPSDTAGSATGISFIVDSLYHINAGTGIGAVKGAGDYDADLVFITRPNAAAAAERARITSLGYLGINRPAPQGLLHGYDAISGFMHWEYDGVDGTARTVIPNGAGDVLYLAGGTYQVRVSDGSLMGGDLASLGFLVPGGSVNLYSIGGDTLALACAADGSVTVQRTAGALTYKVGLWLLWL